LKICRDSPDTSLYLITEVLKQCNNATPTIAVSVVSPVTPVVENNRSVTLLPPFNQRRGGEYFREELAKNALRQKVGNCGELVEIIRSYFKIHHIPMLENFASVKCIFKNHVLLILFETTEKNFATEMSKNRLNFPSIEHCCKYISSHSSNAVLLDPWVNCAADIDDFQKILRSAEALDVEPYFEDSVCLEHFLPCLSPELMQKSRLSDKHESLEFYIRNFDALKQAVENHFNPEIPDQSLTI